MVKKFLPVSVVVATPRQVRAMSFCGLCSLSRLSAEIVHQGFLDWAHGVTADCPPYNKILGILISMTLFLKS